MVKGKDLMLFLATPLLIVSMLFLMSAGGSVTDTTGHDWYFTPNEEHKQPQVANEVSMDGYSVIYSGNETEKKVSITFDAGYDNGYHAPILNILKEKGVSASFFLDGNFVRQNGALVQRMAAEGHIVGNHTLNHADMTKLTDLATYQQQIDGWNDLLTPLGLEPSGYFRFPCGRFSERALEYNERLGLTSVFWTFAYYDWVQEDQPNPEKALEKIMSRMHNGCVLLLHSTSKTNAEILGTLIDTLRAEGYEIVPLNEMQS
ncbi:MAG: polysaccharide deacetylase family protein [Clostridia bacterium]|nr:polysaccharide deacetylase family protein [Clostridia bacterium]